MHRGGWTSRWSCSAAGRIRCRRSGPARRAPAWPWSPAHARPTGDLWWSCGVAYDERLAARIREVISARPDVVERKMFGGLGWTIGGNMACGVMREDHLVVRIDPDETAALVAEPSVSEFGAP